MKSDPEFLALLAEQLNSDQVGVYTRAMACLSRPIPARTDAEFRPFCSDNVQLQAQLDEIRVHLQYLRAKKTVVLLKNESKLKSNAKEYGAKNSEDRMAWCYQDTQHQLDKVEVDAMAAVAERLHGAIWNLKAQMETI